MRAEEKSDVVRGLFCFGSCGVCVCCAWRYGVLCDDSGVGAGV